MVELVGPFLGAGVIPKAGDALDAADIAARHRGRRFHPRVSTDVPATLDGIKWSAATSAE